MIKLECCICEVKHPATLYRINEKERPGLWACDKHIKLFPKRMSDEVIRAIASTLKAVPDIGRSSR